MLPRADPRPRRDHDNRWTGTKRRSRRLTLTLPRDPPPWPSSPAPASASASTVPTPSTAMSTGSTTGSASLRASPAAAADASGPGLPRASTSLSSSTGSSGSSVIRSASALTDAPATPRRSVPALRPTHGHMRHPSNTVIDMGGFSWDDHGSSALAAASAGVVANGETPPIAEDPASATGASGLPGASPTTPATVTLGVRGTPGARTGGARSKVQHLLAQFQDHEYAAAAGAPASVAYYSRHVAGPPPPLSLDRARGMPPDDQVGPSSAPLRTGSMHHPTPPGATATAEQDLGASELGTVLDMSLFGFPGAADASRPSTAGTAATYGMARLSLGHEPPADATGILPGAMPVIPHHLVQREETSNRSHASLLADDYNPTTATSYADSPFPIEDHFVMDADHPPPPPGAYLHHTPPTSSTTVASVPGTSAAAAYYTRSGHQLDWPIAPTQLFRAGGRRRGRATQEGVPRTSTASLGNLRRDGGRTVAARDDGAEAQVPAAVADGRAVGGHGQVGG
ncbi:hypothetical protein AMAG_14465 [Allomyces macrogynus ATCC 38327]|uniref:Uncharacterized protein n=1 Tax=Allomyces macrogynus (strain ATCC 38327) TaxID=578462 RepID=A0A0L0T6E2_ALLM3|nr:hypothetical protein AMAG_14465 [Allomyces macrogynus ATCC 38327]|eukprot:KNE70322.1 hypothetical protein AMAG_14465 [Allomyces macrogynus ATCC 38327]